MNLILATLLGIVVLSVTSHIGFTALLTNHYLIFLSDFISKYFMVFVANALFGQVLEESLIVSELARLLEKLFSTRNAAYGAMLITAVLSYGGVSVFVIVFTVYPLFLAMFQAADLPRRYIPACIMSSSCTVPLSMLPGGAQLNNIIPMVYLGTSPAAASFAGMGAAIITTIFLILYFRYEFAKARRSGEHFEVTKDIAGRISNFQKESHIQPCLSVLPLLLILLLINVFSVDLAYAVFIGTALAMLIGHENIHNKLQTLNEGMQSVGTATIITSVSVGFGGAVLACPGAQLFLQQIADAPISPTVSLSISAAFAGILTGNGGGGADIAMRLLADPYLQRGVSPESIHRIVAIATAGFSCLPNNGMLITVMDTCGYTAKRCYKYIFISTVCGSFLGLLAAVILL